MKKSFFAAALAIAALSFTGCNTTPGGGTVEDINIPQLTQSLIKKTPADADKAVLAKGYIKANAEEMKEYEDFDNIYSYGQGAKTFAEGNESMIGFTSLDNVVNFAQGLGAYEVTAVAGKMPSWFNTLDNEVTNEDVFYAVINTYSDKVSTKTYYDGKIFNEMLEQAKSVSEELYQTYRSKFGTKEEFVEDIKNLGTFELMALKVRVTDQNKKEGYVSQISGSNYNDRVDNFIGGIYLASYGDVSEYIDSENNAPAKGMAPVRFMTTKKMLKK